MPVTLGPHLRIAGLDISLTSTGIATTAGTTHIPTKGKRADSLTQRHARFQTITRALFDALGHCDLAVVENPAYGAPGGSTWDRGGLWWLIVDGLLDREIPVALVTPRGRAKYATGNGAADKKAVLVAVGRRYGAALANDDEADALTLRAMGHDWLGQPLALVPDTHRAALDACQWPLYGLPEVTR